MLAKFLKRQRRHARVRAKISGTTERPRLSIYRSNTNIYAQIIDDSEGKTLASYSDLKITEGTKLERAKKVGEEVATRAKELKIDSIVFDKGGFNYHGRVKALADSARSGGLKF